jgi:hypothetical protein
MSHDAAHTNATPSAPQAPASPPTGANVASDAGNSPNAAHGARVVGQRDTDGTGSMAHGVVQRQTLLAAGQPSGASGTLHAAQKSPAGALNAAAAPVQPAPTSGETEVDVFLMQNAHARPDFAFYFVQRPDSVMQKCHDDVMLRVQDLKNQSEDDWKELIKEKGPRIHLRKEVDRFLAAHQVRHVARRFTASTCLAYRIPCTRGSSSLSTTARPLKSIARACTT